MTKIGRCPYCGGTRGYYEAYVATHGLMFGWDGTEKGELEPRMHKRRSPLRCIDCDRVIGTRPQGGHGE